MRSWLFSSSCPEPNELLAICYVFWPWVLHLDNCIQIAAISIVQSADASYRKVPSHLESYRSIVCNLYWLQDKVFATVAKKAIIVHACILSCIFFYSTRAHLMHQWQTATVRLQKQKARLQKKLFRFNSKEHCLWTIISIFVQLQLPVARII